MKTIFRGGFSPPDERIRRPKSDLNSYLDELMGSLPVARQRNSQKKRLIIGNFLG